MKFWAIFRFEIGYQLRRPSTCIFFLAILGLVFLVLHEFVEYTMRTGGELLINSPVSIAEVTGYASKFSLLLIAALAGDGAMRDIQARMDPLLYTTSLPKASYLGGRFFGTFFVATLLMLIAVPLCLFLATLTVDPAYFGSFNALAYLNAGLFLTLPNVLVATAFMYAIVLFTRRAMAAYAAGVFIFVLSTFSQELVAGNWHLSMLLDPSGINVVNALSRTLAPLQLNKTQINLEGYLLANRALWIGISVAVGMLAYVRFKLNHHTADNRQKQESVLTTEALAGINSTPTHSYDVKRSFNTGTRLYQTGALAGQYFREIVLSPTGLAIPALAIYAFILIPNMAQGPLSVPGLPTTARVTHIMQNAALEIFVVMFVTLVAGQVVWRERDARLADISDAVPVPTSVMLISKYLAVALALFTVQAALLVAGIAIQVVDGYSQPDLGLYLQSLFGFQLPGYLLLAAVALAVHVIINQKYVGHMVVLLFYLYTIIPTIFGIEHKLLVFGSDMGLASSVFYGQEAFIFPWLLFKLYWIGWALLFLVIARQVWVRGREHGFKWRLQEGFKGLRPFPVLLGALVLVVTMGSFIFYHTNVLHDYTTSDESVAQQVAYESLYGKYKNTPQPHLTSTKLHIEFYPEEREALVQGTYQLRNSSENAIDTLHLALSPDVETDGIQFNRKATAVLEDRKLGHLVYALQQPLLPGDSLQMNFKVRYNPEGFSNRGIRTAVIENGSYFNNGDWLPEVGYQPSRELSSDILRKKYGLLTRPVIKSPQDAAARVDRSGQEKIRFEVTIGTVAGQVAVAPGSLKRSWTQNGRQYFHYVADNPIRNMYHVYSGKYAVRKSQWKDVAVQIYHHPQHVLNLDRIEKGMKGSLEYYTKNFSAYPFRQLSFVEYPDPGTGGISLPGTIGYSTNFALLNPEKDERKFDLPFAVAAHEVAHQWWAHQLVPADVKGAVLLTESLAWYSALGVVEQEQGKEYLQNLLDAMRQEFLNPRSRAAVPLLEATDSFQGYRKGPLSMYALREYVGEKQVNQALHNLLQKFKAGQPPYATSLDFYAAVKEVTPDSLHYLLQDLFATNTFWELKTDEAKSEPTKDGNWLVTLEVRARKVRVDTLGAETEVPMNDLIEIGVYGSKEDGSQRTLYLDKHKIRSGKNLIKVKVIEKPEEAGIDPRNLLIDVEPHNNIGKVVSAFMKGEN